MHLAPLACAALLASTAAPPAPSTTAGARDASSSKPTETLDVPHVDVDEPRNGALLVLAAGTLSSIASGTAFVVGFDAERELRSAVHDEAAADALLNKRTIAGWVAWPTAIVGVAGVSTGVALLALHTTPDETHAPTTPAPTPTTNAPAPATEAPATPTTSTPPTPPATTDQPATSEGGTP